MSNDYRRKGLLARMTGHSVAANLLMFAFLIGGLLTIGRIRQEVFPAITLDTVTVTVAYPGASPEEVERGVILPVEQVLEGLTGVKQVTSKASESVGVITVQALNGTDMATLSDDVKNEVDRITTFPEDAESPNIAVSTRDRQVLSVVLHGKANIRTLHTWAERLRDELLQDRALTKISLRGIPAVEIAVHVSMDNLQRYNLTLDQVSKAINTWAIERPGGSIDTTSGEVLLRVQERRDTAMALADVPVATRPDGSILTLGQIATLRDGYEDSDEYATFDGERAVFLDVYAVADQGPIEVSDAVRAKLEAVGGDIPPGLHLDIDDDNSTVFRQRVDLLVRNGLFGLVLVFITLGIFLEPRLAFWVMMGIPVSFMGSFLILPLLDVSINMITLFAYLIALGIVVDDAIVVGENVFHYRQQGLSPMDAAVTGVQEVALPVVFSILTNCVMFLPIYFIPGFMGKIFKMIAIVVIIVFLISMVESLFVLPAHLAHMKLTSSNKLVGGLLRFQARISRGIEMLINIIYRPILAATLRLRYLTAAGGLSLLIVVGAFAASGRMGFGLFPKAESDFANVELTLPFGAPIAHTDAAVDHIVAAAEKVATDSGHPEILQYLTTQVGSGGSHKARIRAVLADPEVRATIMSTDEFSRRWRAAVGDLVGIETITFASDFGGPGAGAALTIELSHSDTGVLVAASESLAASLGQYATVSDINDGFQPGKPQYDLRLRPEGKLLGFTAGSIGTQVRAAFQGLEAVRLQRNRDEVTVRVQLPDSERQSEEVLTTLQVRTPAGTWVPLTDVADYSRSRARTSINRRQGRRVVSVTADVTPKSKAEEVLTDLKAGALPQLVKDYPGLSYDFEGEQADMKESLGSLKVTFLLGLLAIYALLAIPFRSYVQPMIVMVAIPFGLIGAIGGHLLMGYDLSIISMLGMVALSGVVVNDSLVLIDFANGWRRDGHDAYDSILNAGMQRFRPIILTTLTTFFGLTPMILETSMQARFLIPMALSLGFGVLFATLITLVLVPALYMIVDDIQVAARALWGSDSEPAEHSSESAAPASAVPVP